MNGHPIRWQAPEPLWGRFGATIAAAAASPDQVRPAIPRFATDDFMHQMIGTLSREPARVGDLLAKPETWRTQQPASGDLVERVPVPRIAQAAARTRTLARPKTSVPAVAPASELKLYQPAHQRYYLVTASLVCGIAGMPDRTVTPGGAEQVGFVVRRLLPASASQSGDQTLREFAFVKDAQSARWRSVADGGDSGQLAPGEELLPLFPLTFRDGIDHGRTLWAGLIPVARREEYIGAVADRNAVPLALGQLQSFRPAPPAAPANSKMARVTQFKREVAEPWKNLIRATYGASERLKETDGQSVEGKRPEVFALNLQWQMQAWLILLDFADYLATYLPDVWDAIVSGSGPGSASPLYVWLGSAKTTPVLSDALRQPLTSSTSSEVRPAKSSLRAALRDIRASRNGLEATEKLYGPGNTDSTTDWPPFHFLLAGLDLAFNPDGAWKALDTLSTAPEPEVEAEASPQASAMGQAQAAAEKIDRLTALIARSMQAGPETNAPALPFALQVRDALAATVADPGWFVARCVYLNRDCGPVHPPALSAPTQRFQLANFFDSDAPARPVRITLPMDTTPAGLRKHNNNTAFVISDILCGQIQRAKGLGLGSLVRSVLPWPLHKDLNVGDGGACANSGGVNIGMICSLSIPIITICALILLMIFVTLFDFIFRWLPYFIMCFPVPGLKGKK